MEMSYPISRLRVAATAAILPRLRIPTPLTFVGADASLSLCQMIAGSGLRRILVVTDRGLMSLGLADRMLQALRAAGVEVDVSADVVPDPGFEVVLAGVERLKAFRADAMLAIAGARRSTAPRPSTSATLTAVTRRSSRACGYTPARAARGCPSLPCPPPPAPDRK